MNSSRNRFPFTPSQWQQLQHQSLIFNHFSSGIPLPPHLLFHLKTTSVYSNHFDIGWSCFQMGLERKTDPEPGRCRRTDGKKWRCSKEAFPESKYCERHMHRGKNRSRKPVEVADQSTNFSTLRTPLLSSSTCSSRFDGKMLFSSPSPSLSLVSSDRNFLHCVSGGFHGLKDQFLASNAVCCSLSNSDYRYGMKEEESGEHSFFSEPSGSTNNLSSSSSIDEPWNLSSLTMTSSSSSTSKQYSYLQPHTIKEEEPQKTVHRFFDESPLKKKDDLDDNSSNNASVSTTKLSISIPSSSPDFPIFNSRTHNDG